MSALSSIPDSVLASLPAGAPPAGVLPNFNGPLTSVGTASIIVGAILLPIMITFVGIRLYTKFRIIHLKWWDDCKFPLIYN